MTPFTDHRRGRVKATQVIMVGLCFLGLILSSQVFAQNQTSRNVLNNDMEVPSLASSVSGIPITAEFDTHRVPLPSTECPQPSDTFHMEVNLDWTNHKIHRLDDHSPIQVLLSGTINSDLGNIWNLVAASHLPGQDPNLYFIEDSFGRPGSTYGSDISLTWEISVDGGVFSPMTVGPNNMLSTVFPPGQHTFQVRITGIPQYHQEDGYYQLQLEQMMVPQL